MILYKAKLCGPEVRVPVHVSHRNGAMIEVLSLAQNIIGAEVKTSKNVLGSSPDKNCFCSSINKEDKIASRTKLYVLDRIW